MDFIFVDFDLKMAPQEFNGELFRKVVDHITLLNEDRLLFQFINGIVIEKDYGEI